MEVVKQIHAFAEELNVDGLKALTPDEQKLINEKVKRLDGLTPFHIVAQSLSSENFDQVFKVIKVLVEYKANVNSEILGVTPFTILLDKIVESKDERVAEILDYIIDSYNHISLKAYPNTEEKMNEILDGLKKPKFAKVLNDIILQGGDLIHTAVKDGFTSCVKRLIDSGAKVDFKNDDVEIGTLLGLACRKGYHEILKLLADVDGIFDKPEPLLSIVVRNLAETSEHAASDYIKCFDFLLNHDKVDKNAVNNFNNTALHYAVVDKNEEAIKKLLEKKAYIGIPNKVDKLPINNIDPEVLERHFDYCITANEKRPGDDEYKITLDYACLVPPEPREPEEPGRKVLVPIEYMGGSKELRYLVQHPLIMSFVFGRWKQFKKFLYLDMFARLFHSFPLAALTAFWPTADSPWAIGLQILIILVTIYLVIKVLFQIGVAGTSFLKSGRNCMTIVQIILTVAILYLSMTQVPDQIKNALYIIGPITIMLVAIEVLILLSFLPYTIITTHMVMLKMASKTLMRGLFFYSIILIALALSFFTLFKNIEIGNTEQNNNTNPLINTLSVMKGEHNVSSIEFGQHFSSIWFLFLMFLSIAVMNMFNGLVAPDVQVRFF
jgi:ankyrin repeat protein